MTLQGEDNGSSVFGTSPDSALCAPSLVSYKSVYFLYDKPQPWVSQGSVSSVSPFGELLKVRLVLRALKHSVGIKSEGCAVWTVLPLTSQSPNLHRERVMIDPKKLNNQPRIREIVTDAKLDTTLLSLLSPWAFFYSCATSVWVLYGHRMENPLCVSFIAKYHYSVNNESPIWRLSKCSQVLAHTKKWDYIFQKREGKPNLGFQRMA